MGIISLDPADLKLGTITLSFDAGYEILFASSIVAAGICRGSGDVKMPLFVSAVGVWGIRIELVYLFGIVMDMGLIGVWLAISADVSWRGIMLVMRLKSKKWLPQSVDKVDTKSKTGFRLV